MFQLICSTKSFIKRRLRAFSPVVPLILVLSVGLNVITYFAHEQTGGGRTTFENRLENANSVFKLDPAKLDFLKHNVKNAKRYDGAERKAQTLNVHDENADLKSWQIWENNINTFGVYTEETLGFLTDLVRQPVVGLKTLEDYGTQLKFQLTLADGARVICKPARTDRRTERDPNILYWIDFDKHFAEIAAFHLDRVLEFHRVPPNVGRFLNITSDIEPFVGKNWKETFYVSPTGNKCFVGECEFFCDNLNPICGAPDTFEASCAAWLPFGQGDSHENPWKRAYSRHSKAAWETDPNYCAAVKEEYNSGRRLLDLMDIAVFDFLTGHDDRHSYSTVPIADEEEAAPSLYDNGAGFAYMNFDDKSILTPVIQCCQIRYSTLQRLLNLESSGEEKKLSARMRKSLLRDPLSFGIHGPVLVEGHLRALDRRVSKVLDAVWDCVSVHGANKVILDDGF